MKAWFSRDRRTTRRPLAVPEGTTSLQGISTYSAGQFVVSMSHIIFHLSSTVPTCTYMDRTDSMEPNLERAMLACSKHARRELLFHQCT